MNDVRDVQVGSHYLPTFAVREYPDGSCGYAVHVWATETAILICSSVDVLYSAVSLGLYVSHGPSIPFLVHSSRA